MATFTKVKLSGSTQGNGVKVVATSNPGTTIHATGTASTTIDEVWLYGYNSDTAAVVVTLQFGGTATPDNDIKLSLPPQGGLALIAPGVVVTGSGSVGGTVYAYAGTANKVVLYGYVNRIA